MTTQQRVYQYILDRHAAGELPPTRREIQSDLGLSSMSMADYAVGRLVHLGKLTDERLKSRSIRPVLPEPVVIFENWKDMDGLDGVFIVKKIDAVVGDRAGRIVFEPNPSESEK